MYTEELRAVFGALEQEAPEVSRTLAGLDRLRKRRTARRRATVMATVAAITMALTAGSFVAPNLFRGSAPTPATQAPPARPRQPLEFRFAIDDIPGFQTYYQMADPRFPHLARVFPSPNNEPTDTNTQSYDVNAFAAGQYDPTAARAGEPIEVRGKPGFYRADLPCHCSGQSLINGLAWEYAPNTWALIQYNNHEGHPAAEVKANLIRIAAAVRLDKTTPIRVPFRIGWLPDGLQLGSGNVFTRDPKRPSAILGLAPSASGGPDLTIGMFLFGEPSTRPVGEPAVTHNRLADPGPAVVVNLGPFEVQLSSTSTSDNRAPGLSDEQLVRIARSITPAGVVTDPSTWIPAVEALPAG